MAAILGARGVGNIETNARPKFWMGIAWEAEARENTLAILTSLMPTEESRDIEFNWFERDIERFEVLTNGGNLLSTDTVLTFDDGSGNGVSFNLRKYSLLKNDRTGEIVSVDSDPATNTSTITVTRAFGTTSAAAIVNDDRWTILGFADEDNTTSPSAITTDATLKTNYLQLMREAISVGLVAAGTEFRTGNEYQRRRKEAFLQFVRRWERQFIHGEPKDATGGNSENRRTQTGGVMYPISTNIKDFADAVSESAFDIEVERGFRYGSRKKVLVAGGKLINTINQFAKFGGGSIFTEPGETTYGLHIKTYDHASGMIQMLQNPTMAISTNHNDWGVLLDTLQLRRVIFPGLDMKLRKDVQEGGVLGIKDEILMMAGVKLGLEKHHSLWKNGGTFVV